MSDIPNIEIANFPDHVTPDRWVSDNLNMEKTKQCFYQIKETNVSGVFFDF